MRLILAASLIVAAFAAIPHPCVDKVFQPGWEFVYKYDSHLLTGVPTAGDQYSGFRIRADARFQFNQDVSDSLKVYLKLENVVIFKVHGSLGRDQVPMGPLPNKAPYLEDITNTPQGEEFIHQLTKTSTFSYHNGVVDNIKIEESEPLWSSNAKKGVINLVNLKIQSFDEPTYTVTEEDILGKCNSVYTVTPKIDHVRLSKLRVLNTCVQQPISETGFIAGLRALSEEKDALEPMAHSDYALYTNNNRFSIKKAEMKSTYAFMPFMEETDSVVTYIWQKMSCLKVVEIQSKVDVPRSMRQLKSLVFDAPEPHLSSLRKQERYSLDSRDVPSADNVLSVIDEELSTVVSKMTAPFVHHSIPLHLLKCTQLLRSCSTDEIISLIHKYSCHDEVCQKKLGIVLDIVPTIPTEVGPEVLIRLIKENVISGIPASLMVNMMSVNAKPTPELIQELLQLYKDKCVSAKSDALLSRSVILSVGTLADRLKNLNEKVGVDQQTSLTSLRAVISQLSTMLKTANNQEEQIRLIKTIGNFADPVFLPDLKTLFAIKSTPKPVRIQAIYAIRKFAQMPEIKDQVVQILLPIYMDVDEIYRVRSTAFSTILETRPSYHIVEMIGHKLDSEPDNQIKTLVYSTYLKVARCQTQTPPMRDLIQSIRRCLKWIKPVAVKPWDSQMIENQLYLSSAKTGGFLEQILMKSTKSALPEAYISYFRSLLFGKFFDVIETGVEVAGIENLLKRMFQWFTSESDISIPSVMRILTSTEDETIKGSYLSEELNRILNQLPYAEMEDEEFYAMGYIKLFTNELQYVSFNKEDLASLLQSWDLTNFMRIFLEGRPFRWNKVMSFVENSLVVPSPIGVPVTLNITLVHMTSVTGQFKVEGVQSHIQSLITGSSLSGVPLKVEMKTDISTPTEIIMSMGADMSLMKTGMATKTSISSNIPVECEITFDPSTKKVVTKWNLPQQRVDLFRVIVEPVTFFELVPADSVRSVQIRDHHVDTRPIDSSNLITSKEYQVTLPLLVVPINVEFETRLTLGQPEWSARFPLMGKQEVSLVLNKDATPVQTVRFEVDVTDVFNVLSCSETHRESYRTDRHFMLPYATYNSDDLINVQPDSGFVRRCPAIKVPMYITSDDRSSHSITWLWTWIRSADWMMHQWNIQMVGKSVYGLPYGFNNFKVLNDVVVDFKGMITEDRSRNPVIKWTFAFGLNRCDENKVVLKVLKDAPDYAFEDDERQSNTRYPKTFKFTTTIEHDVVSADVKHYMERVWDLLLPLVDDYIEIVAPSSDSRVLSGLNEVKVYIQVIPQWEKLTAIVALPSGYKYKVNLPWQVPYTTPLTLNHPISLLKPPTTLHELPEWNRLSSYGECEISKTSLRTLDGHVVDLPDSLMEPSCSMLIASDRSSRNHFNFIMTPIDRVGHKKITLMVPELKIEITPVVEKHWYSWRRSVDIEVRVNDEKIPYSRYEPIVLRSKESPEEEPLYIIKETNNMMNVTCLKMGVTVMTDGSIVRVKTSPFYQGQMHGLCGNYNMDHSDDIQSVHYNKDVNLKQHFLQYIIPSSECNVKGI